MDLCVSPCVVSALNAISSPPPAASPPPKALAPKRRGYRLVNRTHHRIWLGQHMTNETVYIAPRSGTKNTLPIFLILTTHKTYPDSTYCTN